jgi:putative phosphoesterase
VLVGLIADTHGVLRPEVAKAFAGVERILHAGDVGELAVLDGLAAIAPVTAVWGNVDGPAIQARTSETATLDLDGVRIVVAHGHRLDSRTPKQVVAAYGPADMVVFGHSHRPLVHDVGPTLAVNPGSAGRGRFSDPVTVALAELEHGRVSARIVPLA